jgi:hypothetical protein
VQAHGRNLQGEIRGALVQFYASHEHLFHVHIENDLLEKVRNEMLVAVNVNFRDKSLTRERKRERLSDDVAENVDHDDGGVLGAVVVGGGDVDGVGDVNVDSVDMVADIRVTVDVSHDDTVLPVGVGEVGHRKVAESTDPDIPDDDDGSDAREVSPKRSSTAAPQMPSPQLEVGGSEVVPRLDSNVSSEET